MNRPTPSPMEANRSERLRIEKQAVIPFSSQHPKQKAGIMEGENASSSEPGNEKHPVSSLRQNQQIKRTAQKKQRAQQPKNPLANNLPGGIGGEQEEPPGRQLFDLGKNTGWLFPILLNVQLVHSLRSRSNGKQDDQDPLIPPCDWGHLIPKKYDKIGCLGGLAILPVSILFAMILTFDLLLGIDAVFSVTLPPILVRNVLSQYVPASLVEWAGDVLPGALSQIPGL